MDPKLLPCAGIIQNPEKDYLRRFGHIATIRNKKCLCIGYSESEVDEYILKYGPREIVMLTNWTDHKDARVKKYPLVIGDITRRTGFKEHEFDAVLTFSVMEHLSDVNGAMQEIGRILKPVGLLFVFFGPAWSSAYGHHIYARPGDPLMDFSAWKMPSHIHLLCDKNEIVEFYKYSGYSDEECAEVLHWFYDTCIINRLMYEDYTHIFNKYFIIVAYETMFNIIDNKLQQVLHDRFNNYYDFSSYGGKYLLINR
jgi:SAM-dependent methyltransferase